MIGQQLYQNGAFTAGQFGVRIDTLDATQQVLANLPIAQNSALFLEISLVVSDQNSAAALVAKGRVLFGRKAGNAARVGNVSTDLISNTFSAPAPNLDVVVAADGQSVDIVYTGKAATNLRWWIEVLQKETR